MNRNDYRKQTVEMRRLEVLSAPCVIRSRHLARLRHAAGMAMLLSIHAEIAPKLQAMRDAEENSRLRYVEEPTPDFPSVRSYACKGQFVSIPGEDKPIFVIGVQSHCGAKKRLSGLPVYDIGNESVPAQYASRAQRETSPSLETRDAGTSYALAPLA